MHRREDVRVIIGYWGLQTIRWGCAFTAFPRRMRLCHARTYVHVKTSQSERQMATKIYKSVQLSMDVCHFENHEQEKEENAEINWKKWTKSSARLAQTRSTQITRVSRKDDIRNRAYWGISYITDHSWRDFMCSKLYTNWYLDVRACTNYEEFRGNS